MRSIGVRELKQRTSEILRQVRETGEEISVTYHGQSVARLVPAQAVKPDLKEIKKVWTSLDQISDEIGQQWPQEVTIAQVLREERR